MGRKTKNRGKVTPPQPATPRLTPGRKILGAPMTQEDYIVLARTVAQEEIKAIASALATQVHRGVQQTMEPLSKRFAELYHKCNELDIHIHALVEVLDAKGLLSKKEVREAAERVTNALVSRQEELKKALMAKAEAESAEAPAEAAAETVEVVAEPAGDGDGGASSGVE